MRAEIISVGTELLLGQIVDTNAAYLSAKLPALGVSVYFRSTVGDNENRIAEALKLAFSRSDVVITIGGLGPTDDDLTKETVAKMLGQRLVVDQYSAERIRRFFLDRGVQMPEANLKQAQTPENGRVLPNDVGTAPGAIFEQDEKAVVVMPGPPGEMIPMFEHYVVPYLREKAGPAAGFIKSRVLRIIGMGESAVAELVRDLFAAENPTVAPLAKGGEVHLRITVQASDEAQADQLIRGTEDKLRERLGGVVFGVDEETLEDVVVRLLIEKRLTAAAAESCTGGLIMHRLTNVPGSSKAFLGGVVAYDNRAKVELLGVSEEDLRSKGAVSHEVARAMASGVGRLLHTDIAVGVTGIAGPGGGTPEKPVGLVYIGISSQEETISQEFRLRGGRIDIKERSALAALAMLRDLLIR